MPSPFIIFGAIDNQDYSVKELVKGDTFDIELDSAFTWDPINGFDADGRKIAQIRDAVG